LQQTGMGARNNSPIWTKILRIIVSGRPSETIVGGEPDLALALEHASSICLRHLGQPA
jgi:hypothetical protein